MAFFKTIDFLKRNNAAILINIVLAKDVMTIGKKVDGEKVVVEALMLGDKQSESEDELTQYCLTVKGTPPALWTQDNWLPVTRFFKDPRFVPKSTLKGTPEVRDKEFQQRQEKSLVDVINKWNQPIKLENFRIKRAEQAPDIGPHGKENLVDVVVWDEHNYSYNVSCKMSHAADLGSGGIAGLQKSVPELVTKLYYQVQVDLYEMGFEEGKVYDIRNIPTVMYGIPDIYAYKMFAGSDEVGGKIDFIYVGPDQVDYNGEEFNGKFWTVAEYAKKKPYYLRLRKRDVHANMVRINFTKLNSHGLPCIFTTGLGDFAAARFVIDDRVPPKATVRQL